MFCARYYLTGLTLCLVSLVACGDDDRGTLDASSALDVGARDVATDRRIPGSPPCSTRAECGANPPCQVVGCEDGVCVVVGFSPEGLRCMVGGSVMTCTDDGRCVRCLVDGDCFSGQTCMDNECR